MVFLLQFPNISPEIFAFDLFGFNIALRWYALAYIAGILLAWRYMVILMNRPHLWHNAPMTPRQVEDMMTWMVIGIIAGGRLGFVFFYNWDYYSENLNEIWHVWNGGMSFHGGALGVVLAGLFYSLKNRLPVLSVGDAIAAATPFGLFFGRLANFINGELWGRPSNVEWAMVFPDPRAQVCPDTWLTICSRHPSQLYEAALEGLVLFLIMAYVIWRKGSLKAPGRMIGVFMAGYGASRFFIEYFRQPDEIFVNESNPLGHVFQISDYGITMGQALSLPMILVGLFFIILSKKRA